jgi:nucleotide-binding universal stress UspA family protein
MYERILVALDGSEVAERVLPHVEPLAQAFNSTVILLEVTTAPETLAAELSTGMDAGAPMILDTKPILEEEEEEAETYLGGVVRRLRAAGIDARADHVPGGAAKAIVRRAEELGVGLIAMATHGRSGLRHLILGSTTESVLHHATCPLLLVRAAEE